MSVTGHIHSTRKFPFGSVDGTRSSRYVFMQQDAGVRCEFSALILQPPTWKIGDRYRTDDR